MNAQAMSQRFELRLDQSVLNKVDSWRANQDDLPSRSEAMRRLVEVGLTKPTKEPITLSNGEKLVVMMLCELFKHLKVNAEIDPAFVEKVISGGHYWALDWEYPHIFHRHEDVETVVSDVVDILDMWSFLERGFKSLSQNDKDRVAIEAKPFGEHVVFTGFDGNGESEYIGVARLLMNELERFSDLKGRELNAYMPMVHVHHRMLAVFEPIRVKLTGRDLNATEIIQILQAKLHPSMRQV